MNVFCGFDWAEGHHDIALVDQDGKLVGKRRINETVKGFAELTAMLAEAGDSEQAQIPVAIETPRGLLVAALRATGRPIYPINPLAVARYRERTSVPGGPQILASRSAPQQIAGKKCKGAKGAGGVTGQENVTNGA
jgi:hypothetical protein